MATENHTSSTDDGLESASNDESTTNESTTDEPASSVPTITANRTTEQPHTRTDHDSYPATEDPEGEGRTYIEIRPSSRPLNHASVSQAMTVLYESLNEPTDDGFFSLFKSTATPPTVEWLLVADGRSDTRIRYLVGTTDEDFLSELEAVLRTALPNTYELTRVEWHPRRINTHLSPTNPQANTSNDRDWYKNDDVYLAGVEYCGHVPLKKDWLTSLTSLKEHTASTKTTHTQTNNRTEDTHEPHRIPLSVLLEKLCDIDVPVIYQLVCRPLGDQRADAERYQADLERGVVTPADRVVDFVFPREEQQLDREALSGSYRDRLDELETRELRRTFCLSARAVALTDENPRKANAAVRRLAREFAHLGGPFHEIRGRVHTDADLHTGITPPASQLFEEIIERTCHIPSYESGWSRLPWKPYESPGIVVAPDEIPGFCFIDGAGLTTHGQRALRIRQSERTGLTLPSSRHLERYSGQDKRCVCH